VRQKGVLWAHAALKPKYCIVPHTFAKPPTLLRAVAKFGGNLTSQNESTFRTMAVRRLANTQIKGHHQCRGMIEHFPNLSRLSRDAHQFWRDSFHATGDARLLLRFEIPE
jgi:hypothetical protein